MFLGKNKRYYFVIVFAGTVFFAFVMGGKGQRKDMQPKDTFFQEFF